MKKTKRFLSFLLSVFLMCGLSGTVALAAEPSFSLTSEQTGYDNIEVHISADNMYLTSCQLYLEFNKDVLMFSGKSSGLKSDLFNAFQTSNDSNIVYISFAALDTVNNQSFATLRFKVKEGKSGYTSFTFTCKNVFAATDSSGNSTFKVTPVCRPYSAKLPSVEFLSAKFSENKRYLGTSAPDTNTLVITAKYSTGETFTINPSQCRISCSPAYDRFTKGIYTYTVEYLGKTATAPVQVYDANATVVSLTIDSLPYKTYYSGTDYGIDETGMNVRANLSDGTYISLDPTEYDIYGFQRGVPGTQTLSVNYKGASACFDIYVEPPFIMGDINSDSKITSADARLALRKAVGLESFTDLQFRAADITRDGSITSADARMILRAAVGLEIL